MDKEQEYTYLMKKAANDFYDLGLRGEALAAFSGWTPEAAPEEEDEAIRKFISLYTAERGIEDISADVIRVLTRLCRVILNEYRRGFAQLKQEPGGASPPRTGAQQSGSGSKEEEQRSGRTFSCFTRIKAQRSGFDSKEERLRVADSATERERRSISGVSDDSEVCSDDKSPRQSGNFDEGRCVNAP